jgi:hypothetical protein
VGRRHASGNAAQDLEDDRTGVTTFAKERTGEEVEDGPTLAAAVVHHDAMAVVGSLASREGMTLRALQAVRLEQLE